jgi:hypothetical protein
VQLPLRQIGVGMAHGVSKILTYGNRAI